MATISTNVTRTSSAGTAARTSSAGTAARLSVAASSLFLLILAALHVLKSDLDPSWRMISEYQIGEHGWLMQTAFVSLAVGTAALVAAVRRHVTGKAANAGLVLLAVAAAGMALAGFAVSDPITATPEELTTHGNLHGLGAMLGIPTFPFAAALIARGLSRSNTWAGTRRALRAATALTWVGLAQFVVAMAILVPANGGFGPETPIGWQNRLLIVSYVGWILTVAVQAARTASTGRN